MFLNKRTQKRRPLYYYLPVVDTETSALIGRLGDITTSGALILSPASMEVGRELAIAISLPPDLHLGSKELHLHATVQWCSPDANPAISLVGCQFSGISSRDQKTIEHLVNAIGFSSEISPSPNPL